ncbi:MAG TPA: hypothetical protein VGB76_19025 [Pyrinomonadaceae bacterium]
MSRLFLQTSGGCDRDARRGLQRRTAGTREMSDGLPSGAGACEY